MNLKNFRINIIIRILIISAAIFGLIYFLIVEKKVIRSFYIIIFIIGAIIEFVIYVDRTNKDLSIFLSALLQNEYTNIYSGIKKGKSFNLLYKTVNQITDRFRALSSEKEMQNLYLKTLVEQINIGIISFDGKNKVYLINNALRNLLQKPFLNNTNIFNEIDPDFLEIIKTIKPSEKKLIKLNLKDELLQLAVQASEFKLKNNYYKLISLQNIKVELEEKELEAFHKLIRVLTHEIMNSVTPITSLTSSIHEIFNIKKVKSSDIDEKTVTYISDGLEAILDRSTGLLNFTQAYQKLTRIPPPKFTKINTSELFERIKILFNPEMIENKIEFSVSINTNAKALLADTELLAQVIINLIKNSIEAVLKIKQAKIIVTIERSNEGKTIICIEDNGIGIPEEEMEKIFIPFYTTKENGSGIGLSLSRQILRLHKGSIMVNSVPGSKTIFTLKF